MERLAFVFFDLDELADSFHEHGRSVGPQFDWVKFAAELVEFLLWDLLDFLSDAAVRLH